MFGQKKRTVPQQNDRPKPVPKAAGTFQVKASLLSLESRLMFDAAAAATAAEVNQERVAQEQAESAVSAEGRGEPTRVENESQELLHAITTYYPGGSRTEIVFVDPTVPNYQELLSGMAPNIAVIMLDGEQDGVEQMASALAGRTGIDAIHLISHGGAGELQLGTGTLTMESMTGQYADELAIIQQALSGQADILLYGCDFAEGQTGQEAATLLSQLTGADVAASTDATGFAALGGDWVLETQIGTIETQIVVDDSIQASWVGLLAAPVVDLNAGGGGNNVTTAFTEQTSVLMAPVGTLSDVDSADLNRMTVTLTARPNGNAVESLSLNAAATTVASGAGLTVSYTASTGVLLISGTASTATYQTILQGILYNNTSDQPTTSSRSITVVARDSTNASSTSRTATVTVTAVNDAPTIASLSGDSRAYSEGAGAVVIESGNAVVADVDSTNLDTGTLTVSIPAGGDATEDVLSIRNQGTGAGQIGVSSNTITYQGVTIGTFTGGSGGSDLVITFNASATPTAVTALVRNITYQNTDTNAPTTGARTVRFVLTDGDGGTSPSYNTTVTVSAVNDAPVLADLALSLTVAEDAGAPSGAVGSLISTFTGGITDVDSGASKGIALTGSNQTNGTWYYTRNGGTTWTAVGTVSNTSALLLADNASTRLYFAPRANYSGTSTAALTVRAWDQSSGTAGSKVSTASNGGTTAFSSATDTVTVTVTAVNDAPTIASLSGDSRAYSEGAGAVVIESGNAVVADVDSTNLDTGTLTVSIPAGGDAAEDVLSIRNQGTGVGQIGVSSGTVTYGGTTIGTVTGGSGGSNLVITFNASATPTAVTALVRNITYQNTDTNAPTTGARTVRFVLTDGDGGTSPNYDTTVTVSAVNDAPVLADTVLTLTVTEDAGVPSGAVGSLISTFTGGITDVDSGASKGIAITGSNQTNGTWYYTRNGGTTWTAVGTVSNTSALLLADNTSTRLYFAPRANYSGTSTAALTVRAWDQTSGTAGTKVTTASNGGTTAFSSATDTIDVTVSAVNDAPVAVDDRVALSFDGVDDYIQVGSDSAFSVSSTMTMEAWVKPAAVGASPGIIINKEGEYEIALGPNGTLWWAFANANPGWSWHDTGVAISLNTWSHLAVSYDNGVVTSYINGVAVETYNGTGVIGDNYPLLNDLRIGGRQNNPTGQFFNGQIDDVQVWNVARGGAEIGVDMSGSLTGAEAGLLGCWQFNEHQGTLVKNLVAANLDGTLGGGVAGQSPIWDGYSIIEDTTLNASVPGVLSNDTDVDGDPLQVQLVTGPANASAFTLNTDGSFTYTPAANFNGTDFFTYRVFDGTALSNLATVTIVVDPVNDAPVLADTALSLTVAEDAGAPSGAVGSLVSAFTGGITDVDSGAVKGLAITGSNETNGTWYYTTNGGTTWTAVGSVSNTSALLLADNGSTRLYFAPSADYNGTSSAALTVRAWDQTSGTAGTKVTTASNGGTTAFSSATDTIDVSVTAVNDAPTDLSTGIELNTDGGNDAYLISDTGLSQSLTATTVEIRFAANNLPLESGLVSFNNPTGDELSIQLDDPSNNLELDFGSGSIVLASAIDYRAALVDGAVHTLSVTWDSTAGNWSVYIDGAHIESGTGLNVGTPLDTTNGQFVFGQEQDGQNSGYDPTQYFSGTFYDVRIWNDIRTAGEIAQYYQQQLDVTPAEAAAVGLVANWQMDGLNGSNQVVELVSGNNLSIAHASGTGFTTGAVSAQLAIEENSANGSRVGFVTTEDSDAGETFSYSLTDSAGGRFAVNSATGEITVANGTLLDYDTATSHTITVRVTDSGGLTYDETFTINLTNVNETPTDLSLSANTVAENAANGTVVGTASTTDPDTGDTHTYSLLDSAGGRFAIDTNTGQITVADGTLLDYESATSHTITVRTTDVGGLTFDQTLTINLTNVNEASTFTNLTGTPTYTEGGSPVVLDADVQLTDPELSAADNFNGSTLTLVRNGGTNAEDVFGATGTLSPLIDEGPLIVNGIVIGGVLQNANGTLILAFGPNATNALVNQAMQQIAYSNSSDTPPSTVQVNWTFNDGNSGGQGTGGALTASGSTTITIVPTNDAPVLTPVAPDVTFVEDGSPQVVDATGTIVDPDSADFDGGILMVSISANGTADDRLLVGNFGTGPGQVGLSGNNVTYGGTVIGTVSGGTSGSDPLVITFNTGATPSAVQEVYRSIQFSTVSDDPSTATRQIAFDLTDGDGGTATPQTKLVYVQAVNDAPVNTVPWAQSVNEDTSLVISGLSVTDVDGNLSSVQLAVSNGTLNVTLSGTASISAGANGSNTLTLLGSQADINAALATLTYQGTLNFNGVDTLTVTSTDSNNVTDVDTVALIVTPVNDPTLVTGGTSGTGPEDTTLTGTLTATDVEGLSDGTVFSVSTNATNGTASIDPSTGLWSYTPNADFNGSDSFTVTITDDAGNTATQVISVTVTPVVDLTDDSLTTNEDTAISANVLTGTMGATADSFEGTPVLTSVTQGTNGSVTFLADGTVTYTPNANFTGTDSFTYTITSGGVTETATVTVTVNAVNDAPVLVTNMGSTVVEGGTDTIDASELAVTDLEQAAAQLTYSIGTGPAYGRLELTTAPGVSATTFTQADIAANRLIYIHDGSETTNDSFTLTVNDGAGGSLGLTTVTLTITPVNDAPTITSNGGGSMAAINVAENVSAVTIVTGADVDLPAQALTYSISGGVDQARFTINAVTGALNFTAPPDFEAATDANGDNVYVVQVQVMDSQGVRATQTIQVTVTDVAEGVPPPPTVPPVLLSPPPLSEGPIPEPGTPAPVGPPTSADDGLLPPPVPSGPRVSPPELRPISQGPLTLVPPPDRPLERVAEDPRKPMDDVKDRPLFLVNDDQGRPLYSVLPVEPAPTQEPEPPETTPSVSDLLMAKLDEMAVSLEQAVSQSQERHELMARVAAVTGTTLSVGFVAWALRSGAILASMLATMPAWQHFDPLPVVKLTRNERKHRRDEATRAQQQEAAEFKGLGRVLDEQPPLKRTA